MSARSATARIGSTYAPYATQYKLGSCGIPCCYHIGYRGGQFKQILAVYIP